MKRLNWRKQVWSVAVLPVVVVTATATKWSRERDGRLPCDLEESWPADSPLYLWWAHGDAPAPDNYNLLARLRLRDDQGRDVPFMVGEDGRGVIAICPEGGLPPGRSYTWRVGPFDDVASHQYLPVEHFEHEGTWELTAGPGAASDVAGTVSECNEKAALYDDIAPLYGGGGCEDETGW